MGVAGGSTGSTGDYVRNWRYFIVSNMGEIIKMFAQNRAGVVLVRCCASCKYHNPDVVHEGVCFCKKTGERRRIDDLCSDHEIDDRPHMLGGVSLLNLRPVPTGRIKNPKYIRYIQSKIADRNCNDMTQAEFCTMMEDLRLTWEKENGSRYLSKW